MIEIITKDEYKERVYRVLVKDVYKDLVYAVNASITRSIKKGVLYGGVTIGWMLVSETKTVAEAKKEIEFIFQKSGWECSYEGDTSPESNLIYLKIIFDVR